MKKKACIVDIKKNSGKDNHLLTLTFVIYRHPVTLFTRDADWHKLITDLFYNFVSILLVCVLGIPKDKFSKQMKKKKYLVTEL